MTFEDAPSASTPRTKKPDSNPLPLTSNKSNSATNAMRRSPNELENRRNNSMHPNTRKKTREYKDCRIKLQKMLDVVGLEVFRPAASSILNEERERKQAEREIREAEEKLFALKKRKEKIFKTKRPKPLNKTRKR